MQSSLSNLAPAQTEGAEKHFAVETIKPVEDKNQVASPVPWKAWCVLFISSIGVFLASVSTSALIIAFPVVLAELNMTMNIMMWVLLVILLLMCSIVPLAGKLGDVVGQSRIYIIGYWCFVLGCLGGGFVQSANKGYDLLAARVVIGFGAALLFTNSSAILTNAFAPCGKVGLSQGIMQIFAALGATLGPLIGGAFASTNWRWIFWFNAIPGGLCAVLASLVLEDDKERVRRTLTDHARRFDFAGTLFCIASLVLLLMAMIQAVVPDPVLSQTGPLVALIVCGVASAGAFVADQYLASDPLIPLGIFRSGVFSLSTVSRTLMAFARNSVTYNMIFFLQGPLGQDPMQAGITLIPNGVGIMVGGFVSGGLADRFGIRAMIILGPLITLAGAACLCVMDESTSPAYAAGVLFLTGLGLGLHQSPAAMANMLSVPAGRRGVAAAVGMLTSTFCMMVGMVLTFSLVLHSMTQEQLFALFLNGGGLATAGGGSGGSQGMLDALAKDYYVVIACCGAAALVGAALPTDLDQRLKSQPPATAGTDGKEAAAAARVEGGVNGEVVIAVRVDSDGGASVPGPGKAAAVSTAHAVWSEARQAFAWPAATCTDPDGEEQEPGCATSPPSPDESTAAAAELDPALPPAGDRVQAFVGEDAGSA